MARGDEGRDLDRLIATALQVNGRAAWGLLARLLRVPERTVARRGQRLLDAGVVRVSTYLDTTRVGHARPLVIQVRTISGQALNVARVLARREDASSVSVLEGSGDVVCMLLPRSPEASANVLLHEIPAIDGVVSTETSTVLRYFRSGYDWHGGQLPEDVLKGLRADLPAQEATLAREPVLLSREDEDLIARLAEDGRSPVAVLARELNSTAPTIKRRLDALFRAGVLHVRTEVDPGLLGLRVEAMSWLQVPADEVEQVGLALGQHPAVRFCVAATGTSQIVIDSLVANASDLYDFLTRDVAAHRSATIARCSIVVMPVRRGPMTILAGTDEQSP